jgi:putative transposase
MHANSVDRQIPLPNHWHRHVRSAIVHAISMAHVALTATMARAENHFDELVRLRALNERLERRNELLVEELRIKDTRMERVDPRRRPHYPPAERLAILELRAANGWSQAETARRLLVTPLTVASWTQRLDDEGPDALVQVREPVNRFPELVGYLVRRLRVLCPRMGSRRIARVFARAGLHLGATTVRRELKPAPKPKPESRRPSTARLVTAKHPNHVAHLDLTTVPTIGGFWISWWPFAIPQRWPFCWWVAVVEDHFSRRCLGQATFKKEPSAREMTTFLKRVSRVVGQLPSHLITDHGPQFIADEFMVWCRRHGIDQRFGAIGKYGSLAVIERFIKSMKNECTRLLPIVPLARAAFGRELDEYVAWYNAERPHSRFGTRTPDEVYFGKFPACRKPRFEPRERWPRRSRCAGPQALVRGRPGAVLELSVEHRGDRKHLPVVSLKRVA